MATKAYQLPPLAPLTGGIDYGLLPTPDTGMSPNGHGRRGGKVGNGRQSGASLDAMARHGMWPTPTAMGGGGSSRSGDRRDETPTLQGMARKGLLFPTPSAVSYGSSNNGCPGDGRKEYATKGKPSLDTMARKGLWPTGRMWSTPTARDANTIKKVMRGKGSLAKGSQIIEPLAVQAARSIWPTPANRDYRHPNAVPYSQRGGGTKGEQLPNAVGGALNPQWVSWLMGFPVDWCDLKDELPRVSRKESASSAPSATPSSLRFQRSSGTRS